MEQDRTNGFKYSAFISYSHRDKKAAKKLQKRLENYHLPSDLAESYPGLPENLSPVFIDESNLAPRGSLQKALQANLDRSNYLIVICSPNSAKSEYVNDEIEYFIKLGRAEHIIPLIIDGEPHAKDPSRECFPPAILNFPRGQEPLGISVKTHGTNDAFIRVIAAMLELDLDSFSEREQITRRKKICIFSSIAAVFAILAGWLIWYNVPHYKYYHSYIYKWEKPVGIFEVKSESDRKKMEYTYKITTLRGRVTQIERVNSAGILVDPEMTDSLVELPMIKFVSDTKVEYYDKYKHKVFRKEYTDDMKSVEFYCGDGYIHYALPSDINTEYSMSKYNPEFSFNQDSGNIIKLTLEHDENGYLVKKMFRSDNHGGRDKKGTPAKDSKGRWGLGYIVDDFGRVTAIHYLDKNGNPMSVHGVYYEIIEYGSRPYPVMSAFLDKNDSLVKGPNGFAYTNINYDEYCNVVKFLCYDTNGKPVLNTESNIFAAVFTHDPANGFVTSVSCYDTESKPCLCKEEYFSSKFEYNREGRVIRAFFYDVDGNRTMHKEGYSAIKIEYDDAGHILRAAYFDTDNKPARFFSVYGLKFCYEDGFMTRIDCLDADGNLMVHEDGYVSIMFTYNKEENKVASITRLDGFGNKVTASDIVAEVRIEYDNGNVSRKSFYDADGNLTDDGDGIAVYIYDWKDGKLISEKYLDVESKLTPNFLGYAKISYEYDDNGLMIWKRYYDANNKRTSALGLYSAVKYTYDENGNEMDRTLYDENDKPLPQE